MELQKKEMKRGRIQIERELKEKNDKEKRRTNPKRNQSSSSSSSSSSKKMSKRSNSFFGSFRSRTRSLSNAESDGGTGGGDSGGMKNKIRVPLRGGGGGSSSSSSSSSRGGGTTTTKGHSKTLNIPLLHGGGDDGDGSDDVSLSFETKQLNQGEGSSSSGRSSRSSTPIVDSVAVESAREKLLLGLINKKEFLQVIAADAAKSLLESEMDVEESEEISPPLPPRARQPGLDSVTADDVEEWV